MPYNPGWGRSQETYGEETYQIGQMGAALVRGVQDEDIMACVKHYAFNDMETPVSSAALPAIRERSRKFIFRTLRIAWTRGRPAS